MLGDPALAEDDTSLRVEPDGQIDRCNLPDFCPQDLWVLRDCQRVQVYNTKVVVVLILYGNPVLERPEVVPEMEVTARLDAAEYSLSALHRAYFSGRAEDRCTRD